MVGTPGNPKPRNWLGGGLIIATCIVLCLGVLLVWFAILRENPVFWTPAGGYSKRLQDLVLHTYLPLWFVDAGVLVGLGMVCCSRLGRSLRFFVVEVWLLAMCSALLATSAIISVTNNVLNLIHGQPLHHHQKK